MAYNSETSSQALTKFVVKCMAFMKGVLSHQQYRLIGKQPDPNACLAQQLLQAFFTPERLLELSRHLILRFLILTQEDLREWEENPEEFIKDDELDAWQDNPKVGRRNCSCAV